VLSTPAKEESNQNETNSIFSHLLAAFLIQLGDIFLVPFLTNIAIARVEDVKDAITTG